jgi:hypothetical protein
MFLFYLQIIIPICPTYVLVGKGCKCSLYSGKNFQFDQYTPLDRRAVIWYIHDGPSFGIFMNISVCCQSVFFFPKLFSVEFLAQNVVFSFVCLNNLMMIMVFFPA